MERDDARGSEATEGLERERQQRGFDRGGEERPTSAEREAGRRAEVERHQRETPSDFAGRGHDDERGDDARADADDVERG